MDYNFQPKGLKSEYGWYSRGRLPHFDGGEIPQFITFRLHDSLPQEVLEKWRLEAETDADLRKRVEKYLDAGYGGSWLKHENIATVVQNALLFHDEKKYRLSAWVIMPNHGHLLATPKAGFSLGEIMHSIKSYTAHEANKLLDRKGAFWQHESFDRYIRNQKHFYSVIRYIENNPVKAKLCNNPEDWRFSSARFRVTEG